ncbi:DUF6961 family protein [Sphingomonas corticis]|uniref:Uncharacterized protein n=1 Tax=Sphingomonas corticis TaxID=2722791 RepID=A0ABX1CQ16_9SPHN|nr:hypothetical protein [Sphingomonas corticis]NJR80040.1 hypothetical protein [Sphingomonas corticis]
MNQDEERWAEALHLERAHGDRALEWVAVRAAELERKGDAAGVERMREIWSRLKQLVGDDRRH